MNNFTKGKAILYLVAIFIAGAACGSIIGYSSGKQQGVSPARQKEISERTLKRLQSRLSLSPEQIGKIKPIVEQNSASMQNLQRESWLRVSDTFKRMNAQISNHLTEEQKRKLEAMENERCENVRKKCGSPKSSAEPASTHDGPRKE